MKSELVNPGGVRSVISQAAGLLWDKNKTPQGPRGGARQAGNRIPDTQSREGLELLALAMRRLSQLQKKLTVALNPVLLQPQFPPPLPRPAIFQKLTP